MFMREREIQRSPHGVGTMQELIAKLEAATEGSRWLDSIIGMVDYANIGAQAINGRDDIYLEFGPDEYGSMVCPHYTTSLDAALTWENIEEVALFDKVEGEPLGTVWEAWHVDLQTGITICGCGHTEALARRIAALRARGK